MRYFINRILQSLYWLFVSIPHLFSQQEPPAFFAAQSVFEALENEPFEVTFIFKKNLHDKSGWPILEMPGLDGIEVLTDPVQFTQTNVINGEIRHEKNWIFIMRAAKPGEYQMNSLAVKFRDSLFQCNPVKIIVQKKSDQSVVPKKDFFIVSKLSTEKAVVGQQVILEYVLYTTKSVQDIYDPTIPALFGVYVDEIYVPDELPVQQSIQDSTIFTVKTIKKFALYPMQEGTLIIPPKIFRFEISSQNDNPTYFFENPEKKKSSLIVYDNLKLEVCMVPGMPVGNFSVDCDEIFMTLLRPGEEDNYYTCQLTMKSHGNPIFLLPPDLELPKAHVEITLQSVVKDNTAGLQSYTREFRYRIAFTNKGKYKIQPRVNSWDSEAGRWKMVMTDAPIEIVVEKTTQKNPVKKLESSKSKPSPKDVFWLVDVSSSMLAKDFEPSRLEVLKKNLEILVETKPNKERISILAFAGETSQLIPLTDNRDSLLKALVKLDTGITVDGTSLGNGMIYALAELESSQASSKEIVVFSDFVDNTGYFNAEYVASIISNFNVRLTLVAITKEGMWMVPISRRSNGDYVFGNVEVEINKELLVRIASESGARVFFIENEEGYRVLKKNLPKSKFQKPTKMYSVLDKNLVEIYFKNIRLMNRMTLAR